jgi:hypothetical protein
MLDNFQPAVTTHSGRPSRVMRICAMWALLLTVGLASVSAGCAKAQAKTSLESPPLNVPPPPARVLAPVDEPLAEAPPATTEQPATPQPQPPVARPAPPPRRQTTTGTTPAPSGETAPDTAAQQPPATAQPAPPRVPAQPDTAAERRVRDKMREADANLKRVDYRKLSADGQAQYDQSKRLSDQAEQELKVYNYALAATMADKAAELATGLLGR